MSQEIEPYVIPELLGPNLHRLTKHLGKPTLRIDSGLQKVRAWGKMGGTELKITHNNLTGYWTLQFMIITPDTSYRKRLNNTTFDLAQSWLEANADFIIENMGHAT